ncbi:MAG TPA: GNAT family N-acetyltransferase [Clostridia bacterium]|nr:GNAT family N-acetyltransferase [Clostridia bacterium]
MTIRKAVPSDSKILTALTFASKRYWNYPEEYIRIWEDELTILEDYINNNEVYAAEVSGYIAGYASILYNPEDHLSGLTLVRKGYWLEHLFIHPDFIRQGIGVMLLDHVKSKCRDIGDCTKLFIFADPHAKGFYIKQGAVFLEDCPSSIPGRTLPLLELDIL